jgi:hypothetical protein
MHGVIDLSGELNINEIAVEGYVYLYPMVMMEVTRRQISTGDRRNPEQKTANLFLHNHEMANDKWRSVARTNIDTLFSNAWIDLAEGPATVTFPPADNRYHMFQMLDMWTDTYAVVGSRTIGQNGGTVTLVGPAHARTHRSTPHEIVLHCPTPTTWIIGRSYAQHGDDLQRAIEFVDAIVGTSEHQQQFANSVPFPGETSTKVPPVTKVDQLSAQDFFEFASRLVQREGIRNTDGSISLRLRHLGFIPGQNFDFTSVSQEIQNALNEAPRLAHKKIRHLLSSQGKIVNGWSTSQGDIGTYGNSYLQRAAIALIGLAANPTVDAVYIGSIADSNNEKLDGSNTYRIHFENGDLPPAHAFWSITAYDHEGFMMSNRLNRFGIRSRDSVEFNADGSLDLYFAPECPPSAPENNWIPSLPGPVALQIRLYSPAEAYLDGLWTPPPIERIHAI